MGSTADDAARAAAERHDRHAAALERHERQVERAGPMPMLATGKHMKLYSDGRDKGKQMAAFLIYHCEGLHSTYVQGFCDAIADSLTDCREAAEGGTE